MRLITVLIADDDQTMRDALCHVLGAEDDFAVLAVATNATEAIELASIHKPDVALLDVRMPGGGAMAARAIARCSPHTRMAALSAYEDRATVIEMVAAGVTSYVVKGSTNQAILVALRGLMLGQATLTALAGTDILGEFGRVLEQERTQTSQRADLCERITAVLQRERPFRCAYQPIVDLATGALIGEEALARFGHGAPDTWFADAERAGMGVELEMFAVDEALRGRPSHATGPYVSVNFSPGTLLSDRFEESLSDAATLDGVVVEITEHAQVMDYPLLGAKIDRIRACGGRIAIDDAGAGYSSLKHILRLKPEIVKLDIGLVRDIDDDPARQALTRSLLSFTGGIGATLVAEGIETERELEMLREIGVRSGQGFLLGKPVFDEFAPLPLVRSADTYEVPTPEIVSKIIPRRMAVARP